LASLFAVMCFTLTSYYENLCRAKSNANVIYFSCNWSNWVGI